MEHFRTRSHKRTVTKKFLVMIWLCIGAQHQNYGMFPPTSYSEVPEFGIHALFRSYSTNLVAIFRGRLNTFGICWRQNDFPSQNKKFLILISSSHLGGTPSLRRSVSNRIIMFCFVIAPEAQYRYIQ